MEQRQVHRPRDEAGRELDGRARARSLLVRAGYAARELRDLVGVLVETADNDRIAEDARHAAQCVVGMLDECDNVLALLGFTDAQPHQPEPE